MGRFEVPREPADIDLGVFVDRYYRPRKPVIIEGIDLGEPFVRSLTPERLEQLLSSRKDAVHERANAWMIDDHSFFPEPPRWPPLCTALLARIETTGPPSIRLWTSSCRTFTAWHYDGNCMDGLNCSVLGRKRWSLVSPDTPVPWISFSEASRKLNEPLDEAERRDLDWSECELAAGDLLFLPRHWFHHVESRDEWNVNLNWTWTDRNVPLDTRTSHREVEMVALRYLISRFMEKLLRRRSRSDFIERYGGTENCQMPREFLSRTGYGRLTFRFLTEVAGAPSPRTLRRFRRSLTALNDGVPRSAGDYWVKKRRARRASEVAPPGA
jgi:hypothetical protein